MQLLQMIFAEKKKIQASESTLMQHEQDAVSMMTVNTRMYAVGYGSATGLTVGGLMRAINPSAFRARHRFWAWVAPSVAWGALQGMQTGARTSTIALLNLPESPFADKLITHLETHVPESPLLQEVSPTRKRANWCAPAARRRPAPPSPHPGQCVCAGGSTRRRSRRSSSGRRRRRSSSRTSGSGSRSSRTSGSSSRRRSSPRRRSPPHCRPGHAARPPSGCPPRCRPRTAEAKPSARWTRIHQQRIAQLRRL